MRLRYILRTLILFAALRGIAGASGVFKAGAAKSDIRITADMWPVDGFGSQHDPLSVRVLLLDDGVTRGAIVVIDQTSISDAVVANVKVAITRLAGVQPENAMVIASHTFSAPHVLARGGPGGGPGGPPRGAPGANGPPPAARSGGPGGELSPAVAAFSRAIDASVEEATTRAKAAMQVATVGFANGVSDVSVNRDVSTPRGWWLGGDAAGFSDRSLPVIRIDGKDGNPIAILINEAVQSSIMDLHASDAKGGGIPVSADLAGAATRFVEQQYGGDTVAIFLIGAAGDQAPVFQGNRYVLGRDGNTTRADLHEAGYLLVDLIGERLGSESLQVAEGIKPAASPSIQVWRRSVKVPSQAQSRGLPTEPVLSYNYVSGPEIDVPIVLFRLGDIVLVGLQAELAASVGAQLKAASPFGETLVVTMVDGAAKYMPDARSYDRFTYEARNSRYARGSAELTETVVVDLLKQMKQSQAGK